ncbi:hypothetical protein BX600DRAFT_448411 [Xylariales sp. PMI_506]|nr:hypothetical protein BX600DRAFT_448411 [Xylariales sp. PMI_506]
MATSRGERMQERLRGAGRHEVADDSFGFVLPVDETPAAEPEIEQPQPTPKPAAAARSQPTTSAKRRKLSAKTSPSTQPVSPSARSRLSTHRPSSASRPDPYDLALQEPRNEPELPSSGPERLVSNAESEDVLESLPDAMARPVSRGSVASKLSVGPQVMEEVTESPAGAPGSGHRRRVRISSVVTQSAELQRMVMDQEAGAADELTTSSPLARKTRKSVASPIVLSARSTRSTGPIRRSNLSKTVQDSDGSSPRGQSSLQSNGSPGTVSATSDQSIEQQSPTNGGNGEEDELSSPMLLVESRRKAQVKSKARGGRSKQQSIAGKESEAAKPDVDEEVAEEIDAREAAKRIVRKRPRPSPPKGGSPELDSHIVESAQPTKRRRQKRPQESPAKQAHPKLQKKRRNGEKQPRQHSSDEQLIPITVQRYTKPRHHIELDTDADILSADIPFANRSSVNVVDVLSQMCDEVIDANLATLHDAAVNAKVSATKKEYRTKLRALEAFQEELRTRLLEHTIALDALHGLQKRVRSIQKEKLSLRNEIIRIRSEREQVALKMDTIRMRHEADTKESLAQLHLSSTMHDIDLAVETGQAVAELQPKDQKTAELANLELLVSRITGQVSAHGEGGGTLRQIQDFNAFLERAASALEAR